MLQKPSELNVIALQAGSNCSSRFHFQHSATLAEAFLLQVSFVDLPTSVAFSDNFCRIYIQISDLLLYLKASKYWF